MASTYSTLLRLELIATGEQSTTWGNTTNTTLGTLLEATIAGVLAKTLTDADYTLTTNNGSTDEARYQAIAFSGTLTATRAITVPTLQKHYQFENKTTQSLTIKTAAGASASLPAGQVARFYCDGVGVYFATTPVTATTGMPATIGTLASSVANFATLNVSGVTTHGSTPSASTALVAISSTAAIGMDVRGRAADGIGAIRFMNNAGSTEQARFTATSSATPIALTVVSNSTTVFSADSSGNISFPHTVTSSGLLTGSASLAVTGNATIAGDIIAYRPGAVTTGAIFLNQASTRYLFYDGTQYTMPGAALLVNGSAVWTAGTFTPGNYAALSGAVFSGTTYHDSGTLQIRNASNRNLYFCDAGGTEQGLIYNDTATNQIIVRVGGSGSSGLFYFAAGGNFTAAANVYAFSDRRLKYDFRPLDDATAIVTGLAASVSRFRRYDDPAAAEQVGFIAQDVLPVLPEAVREDDAGTLAVSDRPIVAALVATVAELVARVAALEAAHA